MNFKDKGAAYRYTELCMLSDSLKRENKNNYILLIKNVNDEKLKSLKDEYHSTLILRNNK